MKRGHYNKTQQKIAKAAIIEAMKKTYGVVAPAAKAAGVSRNTVMTWRKADPEFDAACNATLELGLDVAEDALMTAIKKGNVKAIQYYLNCKGKSRGYGISYDINAAVSRPRIEFSDEEQED